MELLEDLKKDLQEYTLHPALLDQAVNVAIRRVGEGLYLPLSYKKFELYGAIPDKFYGYIRKKETKGIEVFSFDITLMDPSGKVFAVITDYTIKKVREAEMKFAGKATIYHELSWKCKELEKNNQSFSNEKVLIFKDEKGIAEEIRNRLSAKKIETIEVQMGSECWTEEDYERFLVKIDAQRLTQIIHLQTITKIDEVKDITELIDIQNRGITSLFNLTRALVNQKINQNLDIVLISDYVNKVTGLEKTIHPHNACLFGIGKVIGREHSNLMCRSIDIDEITPIDQIISEINTKTNTYQVAYREGKRYIEELKKIKIEDVPAREVSIKDNGVYLITGGTGGIGLEMAKYLVGIEKVNIALLHRSNISSEKLKAIRELEKKGATVSCFKANIGKQEEVESVLNGLRNRFGKINGIIHSAGVAGDGFIVRKDKAVFDNVLAPKVQGTWILNHLTQKDDLDFFVLFSSITSILGGAGQGDYTAANTYLDSFAGYRNIQNRRVLTINCTFGKKQEWQ